MEIDPAPDQFPNFHPAQVAFGSDPIRPRFILATGAGTAHHPGPDGVPGRGSTGTGWLSLVTETDPVMDWNCGRLAYSTHPVDLSGWALLVLCKLKFCSNFFFH